jgi:flagellar capping protein FliD
MSRDFDDVIKEVMKSNKEIHKVDDKLSKEINSLDRDIQGLKKDVKSLSDKLDDVLEILNTLTIFIEDAESILDEDDAEEEYQSNEGWLPEVNNWEENRDDDDEDI